MNNSSSAGKTSMVGVYILSLISVILWGMSYLWSDKLLSLGLPVEYVVFIRIFIASFLLLGYNLVKKYRIAISKKDLPKFLLLSLFEPFIYFVAETYGIKYTESPTISALIIASTPIFSVIVGVLIFKERFSLMNMFGILICLAGIVMVTLCTESITEGGFILGIVLLLVAVFAEVGYASVTKYLSNDYHPAVIVMYQFFIGSVYLLPIFLTKGIANYDASLYMSWQVWEPLLYLAVLCSGIAFALWANTIKYLGVAKSSIFLAIIPVFTALEGWVLGQEILTAKQWIGIIISCFGVVMSQYVIKKRKAN